MQFRDETSEKQKEVMYQLNLKLTHKPIVEFYEAINNFTSLGVKHEGAVSPPFAGFARTLRETIRLDADSAISEEIKR